MVSASSVKRCAVFYFAFKVHTMMYFPLSFDFSLAYRSISSRDPDLHSMTCGTWSVNRMIHMHSACLNTISLLPVYHCNASVLRSHTG